MKRDARFWWSFGLGVAGLAAVTGLVVRYYQTSQRRLLEAADPRAREVRELLEEAEHLLQMGRRGGVLRKARA